MKTTTANQKTKRNKSFCSCATGPCASKVERGLSKPNPQDMKKMNKNEISEPLEFGRGKGQRMIGDEKSRKATRKRKFKRKENRAKRKRETIARQYMSELRSKAIIDIRI